MVVSEAHGVPVALSLEPASTAEATVAQEALKKVRVPTSGCGRPKTRILELAMDKAFDCRKLRRVLRKRGMRASVPERKRRGQRRQRGPRPKLYPASERRWQVERVNAWLDNYRGLVVRYERKPAHYLAYATFAAIMICLRVLQQW
jgi:transposase